MAKLWEGKDQLGGDGGWFCKPGLCDVVPLYDTALRSSGSCTIPCDPLSYFSTLPYFQNPAEEVFLQKLRSTWTWCSLLVAFLWDQFNPERVAKVVCMPEMC